MPLAGCRVALSRLTALGLLAVSAWGPVATAQARGDTTPAPAAAVIAPIDVVSARMRALNDHDLETFLSLYADDVAITVYPGVPLSSGKSALGDIFEPLMKSGNVAVNVTGMLAAESFVIVERTLIYEDVGEPGIALYRVENGLITAVEFLRDTRRAQVQPRP